MIAQFIATQAFLTIISLPILIAWGLPTSLWSPLGNLLFSPILSAYLLCAVLVFFSEIFSIPNGFLIWILDKVSVFWLWCMSLLPSHATIGFACPHTAILISIPCIAFAVLWYVRSYSQVKRALIFMFLLFTIGGLLKIMDHVEREIYIIKTEDGLYITCAHTKGHVALIAQDTCLARKRSADSWLIYHMMTDIVARTGAVSIDHFVLLHPRQRYFDALATLCQHVTVRNVYIPRWEGTLNTNAWRAYIRMKKIIHERNGKLHVFNKTMNISLIDDMKLVLNKLDKMHTYQEVRYAQYQFQAQN